MRLLPAFVSSLYLIALPCAANADTWEPFTTERYISSNREYEAIVTDDKEAKVFEIADRCNLVWQTTLPDLPQSAYVSDDGECFAVVDTYGGNSPDSPGLVLLRTGRIIGRYKIRDLVDISKAERSVSSIWWNNDRATGFTSNGDNFRIATTWGEKTAFSVLSGERVKERWLSGAVLKPGFPEEHGRQGPQSRSRKRLFADYEPSEKTALLLEGLEEEVSISPASALHLLQHHPEGSWRFALSGTYGINGYHFLLRDAQMLTKQGALLTSFKTEDFRNKAHILVQDVKSLLQQGVTADRQITLTGGILQFGVTFRIASPVYPYVASIPCYVRDDKVDWYSFELRHVLQFVSVMEKHNLLQHVAERYKDSSGIRISMSGSASPGGEDFRALSIGSSVRYEIGEGRISRPQLAQGSEHSR